MSIYGDSIFESKDIINEGSLIQFFRELREWYRKRQEEKIKKEEDEKKREQTKKEIAENGYSQYIYNRCLSDLKKWIEYKNHIPFGHLESYYDIGMDIWYSGVTFSKFSSDFNKDKSKIKKITMKDIVKKHKLYEDDEIISDLIKKYGNQELYSIGSPDENELENDPILA